jgi:hypothetical protein
MDTLFPGSYAAGFLDKMRQDGRSSDIKSYYRNLVETDRKEAIRLINDKDLYFCTLYMLKEELARSGLLKCLNYRNLQALVLSNAIYNKHSKFINSLIHSNKSETHEMLKWILITGSEEDGLDNRFDEILELSGALLVRYYKDIEILPVIADMIFDRKRKGLLIHNLVWAFFEARDPGSFLHIAKYLRSEDKSEYELACRLLNFIPCVRDTRSMKGDDLYRSAYQWLQENISFLRPTGECLHLTANPIPFIIGN